MSIVRTRFAPSPKGLFHIANLRTALLNYAYAKKHNGEFLLRIEDRDSNNIEPKAIQSIFDGLAWLGIKPDNANDVMYESKRLARYQEVVQQLLDNGYAYPCYATEIELEDMQKMAYDNGGLSYNGLWRPEEGKILPDVPSDVNPVIRFKVPRDNNTPLQSEWHDGIRDLVTVPNNGIEDFILMRSDGLPTHNLCCVVDDMDMEITHVIRTDNHIMNTPKQIMLFQALGKTAPVYAHIATMLANKQPRSFLGLRWFDINGEVGQFKEEITPQAMLEYLAKTVWNSKEKTITMNLLKSSFDLKHCRTVPHSFSMDELEHINKKHILMAKPNQLAKLLNLKERESVGAAQPFPVNVEDAIALCQPRAQNLTDLSYMVHNIMYFDPFDHKPTDFFQTEWTKERETFLVNSIHELSETSMWSGWNQSVIMNCLKNQVNKQDVFTLKDLCTLLRLAFFGVEHTTLPIDETMALCGREQSLTRLYEGVEHFKALKNHIVNQ